MNIGRVIRGLCSKGYRVYECISFDAVSAKHMTVENCALLGYYIASSGNFLSTFQDNLSMVKLPCVGPWISTGLLTPFSPMYPGFICCICTLQ